MNDFLLRLAIATGSDSNSTTSVNIPTTNESELLANGLNLVYFIAGAVAVITIIIAGLMYASSTGDAGRVTKSKNLLFYSIIGLIVVLVAFVVTNFVIGRFA